MNKWTKILLVFVFASLIFSQAKKITLKGKVRNQSGEPLPYANVYLEGHLKGSMTDKDGIFEFRIGEPGKYILIASHIGYETYRRSLQIQAGETHYLEITLKEKAIHEETITVTASAFSSGEEKGVTLTPLEVVSSPGAAADVFWAIKSFPGVQQVEEGAGLFVRGGDVSETVVILDGAYFIHPYRYESPNGGFFGTISPFLLKGTFFSSGGYAAEYGNALSGILDMKSLDLPQRRQTNIGLGLAAYSAMLQIPLISDKMGISASGNYSNTRYLFQLNGHERDFSHYPEAYDLNMNWMCRYSQTGMMKLFLFLEKNNVGIEIENPDNRAFYDGNSENHLVNLRWQQLVTPKLLLSGNLAYTNFRQDQKLTVLDFSTDERLYQARLITEYELSSKLNLLNGLEVFQDQILFQGQVPEEYQEHSSLNLDPNAPAIRIDTDYKTQRLAAFTQLQCHPLNSLNYTAGIRYEYQSKSKQQFLDPRFSLTWNIKDNWNVVFSTGQYHQFPKPIFYDPYTGNPDLKAMKSLHYILGFVHQTDSTIYRVEFYHKDYKRLLLEDQNLNYTNLGFGFSRGFDLFIKQDWGILQSRISYSYLKARRKWMDAPVLSSPKFDITHNLTAALRADLTHRLHIGAAYRYATGKPYTSMPNAYHDQRVPTYQKLDLSLYYLYQLFGDNLAVFYIAVSNILGRENIFDYTYSSDYKRRVPVKASMLRSIYFGLSISISL